MLRAGHTGVGENNRVATKLCSVLSEEHRKVFAAHFLLSFDDEGKIARQFGTSFEICLDCLQMCEMLPFVVTSSASEQGATFDARLERERPPEVKRVHGLDIVMTIDHEVTVPA